MEATEQQIDELLEKAWLTMEDTGSLGAEDFLRRCDVEGLAEPAGVLVRLDLLSKHGQELEFTAEGKRRAALVIRHHRLAERLLRDVLHVRGESFEPSACAFEHCLDAEVTQSICTLLGHPTSCPHGKAIPPGPCCAAAGREVQPVLMCLRDLALGQRAKLVYMSSSSHKRLDQLSSVGLLPGAIVQLHQRRPAFVVDVGQTSLALDEQIVSGIYVRPMSGLGRIEDDNRGRGFRRRRRGRGFGGRT
jgi:DtxR family Mn-dependent transcriptional regulator